MVELGVGLEVGILATSLVLMLGLAIWLLFRVETNGEESLFSKIMAPHDDVGEQRIPVQLVLPEAQDGSTTSLLPDQAHSLEIFNQQTRVTSLNGQKESAMNLPRASTIDLPESTDTGQQESVVSPSGRNWEKSAGMFSGQKTSGGILVVDDDPEIRKLIRIILENSGYDVLEAQDGQEAIEKLNEGENPMVVDAIITDLNMPRVNGHEAIAYFQKEHPSIPLIVLTGIADLEVALSFMRQGISNYLVKPIDAKKLALAVGRALSQRKLSWA